MSKFLQGLLHEAAEQSMSYLPTTDACCASASPGLHIVCIVFCCTHTQTKGGKPQGKRLSAVRAARENSSQSTSQRQRRLAICNLVFTCSIPFIAVEPREHGYNPTPEGDVGSTQCLRKSQDAWQTSSTSVFVVITKYRDLHYAWECSDSPARRVQAL